MAEDFMEVAQDVGEYLADVFVHAKPFLVVLVTVFNYIVFPDKAYIPAALALCGAIVLDILTKYYSLSVQNGGLKNALFTKAISSESLWHGTRKKLISYFVVMVLAGLSARFTLLSSITILLSTVVYGIMFLRESQSVVENLIDAGHTDLAWLSGVLKRKEKDMMDDIGGDEKGDDTSGKI